MMGWSWATVGCEVWYPRCPSSPITPSCTPQSASFSSHDSTTLKLFEWVCCILYMLFFFFFLVSWSMLNPLVLCLESLISDHYGERTLSEFIPLYIQGKSSVNICSDRWYEFFAAFSDYYFSVCNDLWGLIITNQILLNAKFVWWIYCLLCTVSVSPGFTASGIFCYVCQCIRNILQKLSKYI